MSTRERRIDRAKRLVRRALIAFGEELREGRLRAGLTQRELGAMVGISHTHVGRIERGLVANVPYSTLVHLGAMVGLDVPLRAFPGGNPIRDAAQLALLHRFRDSLPDALRWRSEVPLGIPGDQRAWDAVIVGTGWAIPVEAETMIRDVQALCRRVSLKQRDGRAPAILLVLADTRHNRHVRRVAAHEFADLFPVRQRDVYDALRRAERPSGSAIVLVAGARPSSRELP